MMLYSKWLETPLPLRMKIAAAFGIEKKGSTEVFNNMVKADGYLLKDIESKITVASMQKHLDTSVSDFTKLWDAVVAVAKGEKPVLEPVTILPKEEVAQFNKNYEERTPGKTAPVAGEEPIEEKPKSRGRVKKNNDEIKAEKAE